MTFANQGESRNFFALTKKTAILFLLVLLFVTVAICLGSSSVPVSASSEGSDYIEPNVRVGLHISDGNKITSYSLSTQEEGQTVAYGIIDRITDEFTEFGRITASGTPVEFTGALDDHYYYIEFRALSMGSKDLALSTIEARSVLEVLMMMSAPEEGMLLPAYHDGFCYRFGPYDEREIAEAYLSEIFLTVGALNEQNLQSPESTITLDAVVSSPDNSSVMLTANKNMVFTFASSGDRVAMAIKPLNDTAFSYRLSDKLSNEYPGIIEFRKMIRDKVSCLFIINTLPLETYVAGVCSIETYPTWPLESHKAFSMVVRTFTVRQGERHTYDFCDICSTTNCQVYTGSGKVNDTIRQAVSETRGLILSYNGTAAKVYYAAVCGGCTVSAVDSWGGQDIQYLQAVPAPWERYRDYAGYTSRAVWHLEYTGAELYKKVKSFNSGTALRDAIADVKIDKFCTNSPYVAQVTVTDTHGTKEIYTQSDTIRYLFGFDSGNFVVGKNGDVVEYPEYSLDCFPSVYSDQYTGLGNYISFGNSDLSILLSGSVTVPFGSVSDCSVLSSTGVSPIDLERVNIKILTSAGLGYTVNQNGLPDILNAKVVKRNVKVKLTGAEGKFIFEGKGWGHGIGFSQYGIWDLSLLGYDYETILKYYIKNVEFTCLTDLGY